MSLKLQILITSLSLMALSGCDSFYGIERLDLDIEGVEVPAIAVKNTQIEARIRTAFPSSCWVLEEISADVDDATKRVTIVGTRKIEDAYTRICNHQVIRDEYLVSFTLRSVGVYSLQDSLGKEYTKIEITD